MLPIRNVLKWLIPERVRLYRYELYEKLRYYPEIVFSLGNRLECPFCGWHFRRFRPAGFHYPVLKEKQVVGGHYHRDNVCPRCMSHARERLVYLFLRDRVSLMSRQLRLLHVAPEPNLSRVLLRCSNIQYVSADLFAPGVMIRFDLLNMPFDDATFDVVVCNHVLEHVVDDQKAMVEIHRILKPGGWALLQVPIALALERTFEDATATSESDRIKLFGQADHVRLYARNDYLTRLKTAGFAVEAYRYPDELGDEMVGRYGLVREEEIYIAAVSEGSKSVRNSG